MRILILGKNGQVGIELQRSLSGLGEMVAAGRAEIDLADLATLRQRVHGQRPDIIVNAAAYTAVDRAEAEVEIARRVNAQAVGLLAEEAHKLNAWLVHYSTDYVFDGEKPTPYIEDDATDPLSVYGKTKLEGEELLRASGARHLILRTSWIYAEHGNNFAKTILRLAREKSELKVVADQHGAPTSAGLIADVTATILRRIGGGLENERLAGTYHLTAAGETTWHGYAQYLLELAAIAGYPLKARAADVQPIAMEAYPTPARRPKNSRLNTAKITSTFNLQLPQWKQHVEQLIDRLRVSALRGAKSACKLQS